MNKASIDQREVEKFAKMANEWWDEEGAFKALHQLNPIRIAYIRDMLKTYHNNIKGLSMVDVGCGGGLLSIPLANMGAKVLGIDITAPNIGVANAYKVQHDITSDVTFQHTSIEQLAAEGHQFDVVLMMEVIEHVANLPAFIASAISITKPGGFVFCSTLNRTVKSHLMAIVGAEYILKWVPVGTHEWDKFVTPAELVSLLEKDGSKILDITGVTYNPLSNDWQLSNNTDINYMLVARKNA